MKTSLVGAALVGVLTAGASSAHSPESADLTSLPALEATRYGDEGGLGSDSIRLASALAAASAFLADDHQSLLVPVGEGGEGGKGRGRERRFYPGPSYNPYRGDPYYRPRYGPYSGYESRPCRILARRVWDPLYGWVTRRERVCY